MRITGIKILFSLLIFLLSGASVSRAHEAAAAGIPTRPIGYEQVLSRALENNFDIELARIDREIARQLLPASLSVYDTLLQAVAAYGYDQFKEPSQFAGQLSKAGNYDLSLGKIFPWGTEIQLGFRNEYFYTDSGFNTVNPAVDSSLELSFRQPLLKNFAGKITRGEVAMARIDISNAALLTWEAIEAALAHTARTYWDLAGIEEEVRYEKGMEDQARYLYELTRKHLGMGMVEKVDLSAAEANLKIRESEVIYDTERMVTASRYLKYLIDDSAPGDLEAGDPLDLPAGAVDLSLENSISTALTNRWDYLRALQELDKKDIEVDITENSRWPEVDLLGSFARNGLDKEWADAADGIFSEDNPRYYLGLEFSHFLENRLAESETEAARLEKARALVEIKKLEKEIYTEVDEKLRAARTSLELGRREETIVRLEREKLEEEEKRFRFGRSSSKTIIDYQNDLLFAQIRAVSARAAFHKALIDLQVARGVFLRNQLGRSFEHDD